MAHTTAPSAAHHLRVGDARMHVSRVSSLRRSLGGNAFERSGRYINTPTVDEHPEQLFAAFRVVRQCSVRKAEASLAVPAVSAVEHWSTVQRPESEMANQLFRQRDERVGRALLRSLTSNRSRAAGRQSSHEFPRGPSRISTRDKVRPLRLA